MESVESALLSGIGCPQLAAVKESRQDTSLIDTHLGPFAQQVISPHSLVEFGHDTGCSDWILELISALGENKLDTVEPN